MATLCVVAATAATVGHLVAGCSDDDAGSPATTSAADHRSTVPPPTSGGATDTVPSSDVTPGERDPDTDWGTPERRVVDDVDEYLSSDGRALLTMSEFVERLVDELDGASPVDCRRLTTEWRRSYDVPQLFELLSGTPDVVVGELWTSQSSAVEQALQLCGVRDGREATRSARLAVRIQGLIDQRPDELGVER